MCVLPQSRSSSTDKEADDGTAVSHQRRIPSRPYRQQAPSMTKTMMKTTMLSLVAALGLVATGARADDSKTSSDSNAVTSDTMNANKKDDLDKMAKKKNKDAAKPSSADPSAAPQ